MSFDRPVGIAGIGLICPAGTGPVASRQAMAMGETATTRHKAYFNRDFERQLSAPVAAVAHLPDMASRVAALAQLALHDLLGRAGRAQPVFDRVILHLAAPEEAGAAADEIAATEAALRGAIGGLAPIASLHIGGSAALAAILADLLADGAWRTALVLSADSLLPKPRLARLDCAGALFSAGNPWGLIPSEAAAAIHLIRAEAAFPLRLAAAATGYEAIGPQDDGPALFRGMSDALNNAMDQARRQGLMQGSGGLIGQFWGDCGQGRYHASEQAHAVIRAASAIRPATALENPCRILGDCGAAGMGLALALGVAGLEGGSICATVGTSHLAGIRGAVLTVAQGAPLSP